MSLSNILESNNPVTPQAWTLLHAQRYKGLSLDVGKLENVVTVNGDPISEYKLNIDNAPAAGTQLLTEIAPRNYQIKTLQAGSGVSLVDSPDSVQINSTVNSYSLAAARFGIDPSSNPGPVIGGLLFDPTLTTGGNFALPMMSTSIGLGIGDNYLDDTDNYFTLISPTELQINVSGKYSLSTNWFVLSNDTLTSCAIQILRNTDIMFTAPPAASNAVNLVPAGTIPISALYSNLYSFQTAIDCSLVAGDIIGVKLYCEGGTGGDTAEITLTSALCIHLIGGTSSGAGSSGVTAVNSLGTGDSLLNPSGAGPVIGVKSLVAGANITLTPTGDDITISSTGGGGPSWDIGGNAGLVGPTEILGSTPSGGQILVSTTGNQLSVIGGEVSGSNLTVGSMSIKSFRDTTSSTLPLPVWSTGLYIKDNTNFTNLQLPPVSTNFNDTARILVCTGNISATSPPLGSGTAVLPNAVGDRLLIQGASTGVGYRLPTNSAAIFVECPGFGHWATFGQVSTLYFREGYFNNLTPDNVTVPDWWLSNNTNSFSANYLDGCSFQVPGNGTYNSQNTSPRLKLESVRFLFDSPNTPPNGWTLRIYTDNNAFPAVAPTNLIFTGSFTTGTSGITWALNTNVLPTFTNYFFRITNIGTGITPRRCKWSITGSMPQ